MPTYNYECTDCHESIELIQSHRQMEEARERLRCQRCEGRMQFVFPRPHLVTNTTFTADWGDGFQEKDPRRKQAMAAARAQGVNPSGKTYCPGLCAPGKSLDPAAWVPHDDAKGYIARRCEELGYSAQGMVNVDKREPESDPHEGPYEVAEDLVEQHTEKLVEDEYDGHVTPEKYQDLKEGMAERLAGDTD
jgi:putative FmdB family regulatory protein